MNSAAVVRFLRRARVAVYVAVAAAIVYLAWRFDTVELPEEGCSPVSSIAPGARIFVDLRPAAPSHGDAVVFRAPDGELLLGVVTAPPASLPPDQRARIEAGDLWIAADVPDCPARDSRALGPIPRGDVEGRVFLSL